MPTSPKALTSLRRSLGAAVARRLQPPPRLTVSQWADAYRYLSRESSAEPGKWTTERAPYQRGIMDALSEPLIETVVVMSSAQVGKTEMVNNAIGYYIDQDPAPLLVLMPTLEMARAWSTDRLAPMLRDTPQLRGRVKEPRTRDSGNTILHKRFAGGHLTAIGANSTAGLSARPIRVLLADEVDRFPPSAGSEGDPIALASKRLSTFWNRKTLLTSTPTIKDLSRIEQAWAESDQRRYWVPCPACGVYQTLKWAGLVWEPDAPESARYACEKCHEAISESQKGELLARGQWVPEFPGRRAAGFHLNALYSPWARWEELVREFLAAKGNPERLQVFVNTVLGESWEERAERISATSLEERREHYEAEVPRGAGLLTAGVDVQADRLELLVVGWGRGEESWRIAHEPLYGDPGREEVWQQLEPLLTRAYRHENGADMRISACAIDSGDQTERVYRFVAPRQGRRVMATKGISQPARPLLGRPSKANKAGIRLYPIGTEAAKDLLFARLRITEPGPGWWHFPDWLSPEYFAQLTAEKAVTKFEKGRATRRYVKIRERNEALDLEVLALAALTSLGQPAIRDLERMVARVQQAGDAAGKPAPSPAPVMLRTQIPQFLRRPRRGGWISGF